MTQANQISKQQLKKSKRKPSLQLFLSDEQKAKRIITEAKQQLDELIVQLDQKIKKKIEMNQSKFMYAYKNHLDRITKQLKAIKQNYDANQTKFCTDTAIVSLGRQCALFRQQAMRLHNQLQDALVDADIYKRKSQLLESQLQKTNKSFKNLIQRLKFMEASNQKLTAQSLQKDKKITYFNQKLLQLQVTKASTQFQKQKITTTQNGKQNLKIQIEQKSQATQRNHLILYSPQNPRITQNYPIFQLSKQSKFNTKQCKKSTPTSERKTRAKTNSTYQNVYSHRNFNNYLLDTQKAYKDQEQIQVKRQSIFESNKQQKLFEAFVTEIKKAKIRFQDSQTSKFQIRSKFMTDFISNNEDMLNFCTLIFPNLGISELQKLIEIPAKYQFRPTLTQLSTQIMRKLNPTLSSNLKNTTRNFNSTVDKAINIGYLDLQFPNKKQKINTQGNQAKDVQISNLLSTARNRSLKKMNQVFKKKTLTSKCNISSLYPLAKQNKSLKQQKFKI